jgi:hypothetical protein
MVFLRKREKFIFVILVSNKKRSCKIRHLDIP